MLTGRIVFALTLIPIAIFACIVVMLNFDKAIEVLHAKVMAWQRRGRLPHGSKAEAPAPSPLAGPRTTAAKEAKRHTVSPK
jgi:hypothetical protein